MPPGRSAIGRDAAGRVLSVGDRVDSRWRGGNNVYPARVLSITLSPQGVPVASLHYDDGDREDGVVPDMMMRRSAGNVAERIASSTAEPEALPARFSSMSFAPLAAGVGDVDSDEEVARAGCGSGASGVLAADWSGRGVEDVGLRRADARLCAATSRGDLAAYDCVLMRLWNLHAAERKPRHGGELESVLHFAANAGSAIVADAAAGDASFVRLVFFFVEQGYLNMLEAVHVIAVARAAAAALSGGGAREGPVGGVRR